MSPETLKSLLAVEFKEDDIYTEGDGSHFGVRVVSDDFDGMTAVKRQQKVYALVKDQIASGELHALSIKTYTQQEWVEFNRLNQF